MADLKEIAEVAYAQIYPNAGTSAPSVKREHFLSVARTRYAFEMYLLSKELSRSEGLFEIPTALLREADLAIVDDEADISSLKIFRSFEGDHWIGAVGGFACGCEYIKYSVNLNNILGCDSEYKGNKRSYTVVGNKIKFPDGTHSKTVPIIYASNGTDLNDGILVDDAVADRVSEYLWKRYSGRIPEDRTNNSNSNT